MNIRTTIILLVVLVVLGGYVLWSGRNADETSETGADDAVTEEVTVLDIDPAAVRVVTVSDADGEQVRLEQNAGTWQITAPAREPADVFAVTRVITDLAELSATRVITPAEQDLSPYGLDQPEYEIILSGENGTLATLRLGTTNPEGTATYLQRDDITPIYLVSTFTLDSAQGWLLEPPVQPTPVPTLPPTPTAAVTPTSAATPAATSTP